MRVVPKYQTQRALKLRPGGVWGVGFPRRGLGCWVPQEDLGCSIPPLAPGVSGAGSELRESWAGVWINRKFKSGVLLL